MNWSRRSFLAAGSMMVVPLAHAGRRRKPGEAPAPAPVTGNAGTALPERTVGSGYPTQDPDLAREMVGVSHGNFARVKELVEARPSLARAAWDWGFGDWETALGAASHVGNRPIAEFLIANGARPTLFSAAMLGQLDVVKAFVAAAPGVQRIYGPHGIPLLAHARAGKDAASAVAQYLETLGDADAHPTLVALTPEQLTQLTGTYGFGPHADERIDIAPAPVPPGASARAPGSELNFTRMGRAPRPLFHLGDLAFHPAGAPAVRIRFTAGGTRALGFSVHDPDVVLKAERIA